MCQYLTYQIEASLKGTDNLFRGSGEVSYKDIPSQFALINPFWRDELTAYKVFRNLHSRFIGDWDVASFIETESYSMIYQTTAADGRFSVISDKLVDHSEDEDQTIVEEFKKDSTLNQYLLSFSEPSKYQARFRFEARIESFQEGLITFYFKQRGFDFNPVTASSLVL